MIKRLNSVLAACAISAIGLPAMAQISSEGGAIYSDADRIESVESDNAAYLIGNVDIQQGDARLRADKVTIKFHQAADGEKSGLTSGFGDVRQIIAEGNVFYVTPEMKAKGDRGVYEQHTDTITMTGNVALMRERDVAEGQSLKIEIGNRRTTLDGGSSTSRMVITPEDNTEN
ncbi:MAG: LptA/OstA family protein [Hyphomonas sp.]